MSRSSVSSVVSSCAQALLAASLCLATGVVRADDAPLEETSPAAAASPENAPSSGLRWSTLWFGGSNDEPVISTAETSLPEEAEQRVFASRHQLMQLAAEENLTIVSRADPEATAPQVSEEPWTEEIPTDSFHGGPGAYSGHDWEWQVLPTGLIYRSYWAGPHEPRISISGITEAGRWLQDATVGGRGGVLRYGNNDPTHVEGYQLDVFGAAIARLDGDHEQDLDSSDYVFGFPITYGVDNWQYKFGYQHVSSHLGDERAIRLPGALDDRVNYVRDALVFGTSWYARPAWRLYGEAGWAFNASGGAKPWEYQVGSELARSGPTGRGGTPFLAVNGDIRQEENMGGNLTAQAGWLWRGITGQVFRFGAHYLNGKSSQFQFYRQSEEQVGMGLWYDF